MCLGPVKGSHKCKVQQIPPTVARVTAQMTVSEGWGGAETLIQLLSLDVRMQPWSGVSGTADNTSDYGRSGMQPFLVL